jgi:hypothetical protein
LTYTKGIKSWIWIAAITLAAIRCIAGEPEVKPAGLSFGPGMTTIGNIPLGKEVDPNMEFEIQNGSKKPRNVRLLVLRPQDSGIARWERGYTAIPDAAWCRLEKQELEIAPESSVKVKAFIKVPDKPEYYNRKFMIAIACEGVPPKNQGSAGINLRLVSRLGIETATNVDVSGEGAGEIALIPSILRENDILPGKEYTTKIKIRNNTAEARTYTPKRLIDIEPDAEKQARYYGPGREAVMTTTWLKPLAPIAIEPGKTVEVKLVVTVPKEVPLGKVYEEVLFLEDDKKNLEFIRVRTAVDK